jgi:hypothetical protein
MITTKPELDISTVHRESVVWTRMVTNRVIHHRVGRSCGINFAMAMEAEFTVLLCIYPLAPRFLPFRPPIMPFCNISNRHADDRTDTRDCISHRCYQVADLGRQVVLTEPPAPSRRLGRVIYRNRPRRPHRALPERRELRDGGDLVHLLQHAVQGPRRPHRLLIEPVAVALAAVVRESMAEAAGKAGQSAAAG